MSGQAPRKVGRPPKNRAYMHKQQVIVLPDRAVVISGPEEGTRTFGDGYGTTEIAKDVLRLSQDSIDDAKTLFSAVENQTSNTVLEGQQPFSTPENDDPAAVTAAVLSGNDSNGASVTTEANEQNILNDSDTATNGEITFSPQLPALPLSPPRNSTVKFETETVNELYEKSLLSMKKAIFLLTEWKAALESTRQQRPAVTTRTVTDPANDDNDDEGTPFLKKEEVVFSSVNSELTVRPDPILSIPVAAAAPAFSKEEGGTIKSGQPAAVVVPAFRGNDGDTMKPGHIPAPTFDEGGALEPGHIPSPEERIAETEKTATETASAAVTTVAALETPTKDNVEVFGV